MMMMMMRRRRRRRRRRRGTTGVEGGASSGPDAPHTISFVVTPEPATAGSTPEEPSFASVEDAPPSSEDVVNVGEGGGREEGAR